MAWGNFVGHEYETAVGMRIGHGRTYMQILFIGYAAAYHHSVSLTEILKPVVGIWGGSDSQGIVHQRVSGQCHSVEAETCKIVFDFVSNAKIRV